jgi:hypothetical protein
MCSCGVISSVFRDDALDATDTVVAALAQVGPSDLSPGEIPEQERLRVGSLRKQKLDEVESFADINSCHKWQYRISDGNYQSSYF